MTAFARLTDAPVDRYRIQRELGAGGMATVYLAEDLKHQRQVAINGRAPPGARPAGLSAVPHPIKRTHLVG